MLDSIEPAQESEEIHEPRCPTSPAVVRNAVEATGAAVQPKVVETTEVLKERKAFEEIVRCHQADVRFIVSKWIRCPATADDIAQEVFLAAYTNLDRFDDQRSLKSWLIGIAKNKARLHLRSEARRRNHESSVLQRQIQDWKSQELERELFTDVEERGRLQECIKRLAPESRQLVGSYYFDGNTLESIARESDRTGGSVRMMLMRIRKALAKCIRGQHSS